jgi:hypothetical protein
VENAHGAIEKSTLEAGSGTAYAAALELLSGSDVKVSDSLLSADRAHGLGIAVSVDGSTLHVSGSTLRSGFVGSTPSSQSGAIAVHATDSVTSFDRSRILSGGSQYFVSLFDILSGSLTVTTCLVTGGASGDSVTAVIQDATSTWLQNTIHAGTGTHLTAAFQIIGGGESRFFNNLILFGGRTETPAALSQAFLLPGYDGSTPGGAGSNTWSGTLEVAGNGFGGWSDLLGAATGNPGTWRPVGVLPDRVQTAAELDGLPVTGAHFHDNVSAPLDSLIGPDGVHIPAGSPAVGGGVLLPPELQKLTETDLSGTARPSANQKNRPDIGAELPVRK